MDSFELLTLHQSPTNLDGSLRSAATPVRTHGQARALSDRFYNADAPPQVTQEGEMIEFLARMPTDTMIFLTMAVLSLPAMLIVLRRLI